ncbi:MAG TPA: hypothetical protein VMH06_02935 [Thermodesulfovibrionales bacterium]|nr:hypothetical protein [Thermodesulfovibrionales bacterium]
MKRFLIALLALSLPAGLVFAGSQDPVHSITLPAVRTELKSGDGREKTETFCAICHSLDYITMQPKFSKAQWTGTVNKMRKVMGAPINEDDAKKITDYLAVHYGTGN